MALLVAMAQHWDAEPWLERFRRLGGGMEIVDARKPYDAASITHAAVWKPDPGMLAGLPNLRAIFNLGAGVDALLADRTLPDVPLIRIIDPDLTARMTEWVTLQALYHFRQMPHYLARQAEAVWEQLDQPGAHEVRVGILGMGVLGRDCADVLKRIGFQVAGWSRSGKAVEGFEMFGGEAGLPAFLARTDILVALLPLTEATRGVLDRKLFAGLARDGRLPGPVLINAGRGGLQVEADILAALDDGTLAGASIDVFETEPLPADNPLWKHPRMIVTPHVAADSTPEGLVAGIVRDIAAFERGEELPNRVDRATGY
ncbi:MAG TPA: glyoxylate/hydroxypyruvate reductase A [Rhabdaerophilum sp.]|nr:glyoxylate/hydroxypyruvate reductase A [Rhabdaerophilum sp.]